MLPSIYGENMLDDFFGTSFFGGHDPLFGKHGRNLMKTDIRETDDAKGYRFAVDLPGFEKDEIHVDVKRVLTRMKRTRRVVSFVRSVMQALAPVVSMSAM